MLSPSCQLRKQWFSTAKQFATQQTREKSGFELPSHFKALSSYAADPYLLRIRTLGRFCAFVSHEKKISG